MSCPRFSCTKRHLKNVCIYCNNADFAKMRNLVHWYVLIHSFLSVKKGNVLGVLYFRKLEKGEEI